MTDVDAINLYRRERAMSERRNAHKIEAIREIMQRVQLKVGLQPINVGRPRKAPTRDEVQAKKRAYDQSWYQANKERIRERAKGQQRTKRERKRSQSNCLPPG